MPQLWSLLATLVISGFGTGSTCIGVTRLTNTAAHTQANAIEEY
jgi:hypothetical protein